MKKGGKHKLLTVLALLAIVTILINNPKVTNVTDGNVNEYDRQLNLKYALDYAVPNEDITWKEGKGTGSIEDPIQISDIDDFDDFLNIIKSGKRFTGMYIVLTNDIEFPEGHAPIVPCTTSNYFAGCFDGQGHVFKNLQIEYKGTSITSLFGRGSGCVIKNVGFDGGTMKITTSADGTGLLIINMASNSLIYNVYSTMDLYAESTNANFWPNGFVLYMSDNGKGNIGYVANTYFGGNIYSNSKTWSAGIARVSNSIDDIDMFNSFTATTSEGVDYNYNSTDGFSAMEDDGYGCKYDSRIDITSQETVEQFNDFILYNAGSGIGWKLSDDGTHMVFDLDNTFSPDDFFEGDGSEESPYLIRSNEDLRRFRALVQANTFEGKYLKQTRDLDFSGEEMQKVLSNENHFYGTYDGDGHVVKNFEMQGSQGAFFGRVFGTIKNFGLQGGTLHVTGSPEWMATLVRGLDGGKLLNCFSSMDVEVGEAETQRAISGLVAYVETAGGEIRNCFYAGHFDSDLFNKKEGSSYAGEYAYGISYTSNSNLRLENTYYIDENIYAAFGRKDSSISNDSFHEVTEEYMKTEDFLNDLNNYSMNNNGFFTWKFNKESGYELPTLDAIVIKGEITDLYVDGTENENVVDSVRWYFDTVSGEYYMFIPGMVDRENLKLHMDVANDTEVTVKAVTDSGDIDLGMVGNHAYTDVFKYDKLIFTDGGDNVDEASYTINVLKSTIGSIHITLDGSEKNLTPELAFKAINNDSNHQTGFPGQVVIGDTDNDTLTEVNLAQMKGRGNSSWKRIKKPYQLKFDSKVSVFGMPASKKWLLITNYEDGSLSRNFAFYEYAREIGFEYGVDYAPIDVYVNNSYLGSYMITSKVEVAPNVVDIGKDEYLLEIDNYVDDYQVTINGDDLITIKNPDLEKYESQEEVEAVKLDVQTKLNHLVDMFADQNYSLEEINEYIDVESLAKMYWVQELSENVDAMRGSVYMYSKDGKFYMGPVWDMDYTLNRQYKWANLEGYFILDNTTQRSKDYFVNWYDGLMQRQEFSDLIDKTFLDSLDYLQNELPQVITDYTEKIQSSAKMNEIRWPYSVMGNATYVGAGYNTGVAIFKKNLKTRIDWYANEYANLKLNKIEYTYTDIEGNEITEELVIEDNDIQIKLPASVDASKAVKVKGFLPDGTQRDISLIKGEQTSPEEVSLEENKYNGKIQVKRDVTASAIKQMNANYYTLDIITEDVVETGIEVDTTNSKIEYHSGDKFDPNGTKVYLTYNDGTKVEVEEFTYSENELTKDNSTITITYREYTKDINVNVYDIKEVLVTKNPDKTEYIVGETIDIEGIEVTLVYENEDRVNTVDYDVTPEVVTADTTEITITSNGKTTTLPITVKPNVIEKIEIEGDIKNEYKVGEAFDTSTIKIIGTYTDGTKKELTEEEYEIEGSPIQEDTTEVIIKCGDKTITIPVTVKKYLKGDMNLDGKVNSTDAAIVLERFTSNSWTEDELLRGDMDENGRLNSTDSALILVVFQSGK